MTKSLNKTRAEPLLIRKHLLHRGVLNRAARKYNVDPSYVSRIISGDRRNQVIFDAVLEDLRAIEKVR
jgi:hypothetical protein